YLIAHELRADLDRRVEVALVVPILDETSVAVPRDRRIEAGGQGLQGALGGLDARDRAQAALQGAIERHRHAHARVHDEEVDDRDRLPEDLALLTAIHAGKALGPVDDDLSDLEADGRRRHRTPLETRLAWRGYPRCSDRRSTPPRVRPGGGSIPG